MMESAARLRAYEFYGNLLVVEQIGAFKEDTE